MIKRDSFDGTTITPYWTTSALFWSSNNENGFIGTNHSTTASSVATGTTRRGFVAASTSLAGGMSHFTDLSWAKETSDSNPWTDSPAPFNQVATIIKVPLQFTGQELLISYKVDDTPFRAVLDTGSPFLMIPGSCGYNTQQKSGCYRNQGESIAGLENTIEIYDGFEGEVEWRQGSFDFINATDEVGQTGTMMNLMKDENRNVIFGVASEDIMGGPGGVFFGMIKYTDARIRPSFLGQTNVQAFRVDLQSRPRTLTLSSESLIDPVIERYIPMTNVLRRRYGDPVGHFTARAQSLDVNGYPLLEASSPLFVIFDTGVTGMVVSRSLFNKQYANARQRKDKSVFGNVTLAFSTNGNRGTATTSLTAIKPLTTPFDPEKQWKRFPKTSHILVLGLAFFQDRLLTIDVDNERILLN